MPGAPAAPARAQILALYRRILFGAARFPSKNRAAIYAEIRDEFRRNAALEPGSAAAREKLGIAQQSLTQLEAYTTMTQSSGDWELDTETNPMPRPPDR